MSHFLISTMPELGHVYPAKPIATALLAPGHQVTWHTGPGAAEVVRSAPVTGGWLVRACDRRWARGWAAAWTAQVTTGVLRPPPRLERRH